ncbi:uncharacterized protein K452DRAFT_318266 [Aplosporella prunicola CBS 121167]|uniref:Uncharacterized protein n=1 Tax=Aplosporella prunicola CBS 121167 TaxID=1176127 RepID=A0A6A6BIP6_9PEZI|nr:uncharacterized protein K452DRAFT_318266 [Aplosporella prunicola CBS 121167]KAF2142697.1 hypothetical protein K452DRAFT_318266 [Aplosporella prunicola CBS 121167]
MEQAINDGMRFRRPISQKWLLGLLHRRSLDESRYRNRNEFLGTLHETVDRIMRMRGEDEKNNNSRRAYVSSLCLFFAVGGCFSMYLIEELMEEKPYQTNDADITRSSLAAAAWLGDARLVEALVSEVDDIDDSSLYFDSPIWAAARQGHARIVRLLIGKGACFNPTGGVVPPIQAACEGGHTEVVRLLINLDPTTVPNSQRHLREAASGNHMELLRFLLDHFDYPDWIKNLALSGACFYGNEEAARFLLNRGADPNTRDIENRDRHTLAIASQRGHIAIVRLLLSRGVDANYYNNWSYNPDAIVWAASRGYTRIIEVLLDAGANVNGAKSTLAAAAERGHVGAAKLLLDRGFDVNRPGVVGDRKGGAGRTAVSQACQYGHTSMVRLLVEYGCDIYYPGHMIRAKEYGHKDVIATLLGLGAPKPEGFEEVEVRKDVTYQTHAPWSVPCEIHLISPDGTIAKTISERDDVAYKMEFVLHTSPFFTYIELKLLMRLKPTGKGNSTLAEVD